LIDEAKRAVAPHDRSKWTASDARAAIKARIAELKRVNKPAEIVVVPEGKHWTAMPQVSKSWKHWAKKPRPTLGANFYTSTTRFVLVPERDLKTIKHTTKHELNHLVFARLSRKTQAEIRAIYDRLQAAHGPFARIYGAQFREFYTTFGEIFEGHHGVESLKRFRDEVADLYEIFCRIRHRRPI
jgi:hypothetical protein